MKDVHNTSVHQFGSGLLVEIIGTDEHGDVATETVEFDVVEPEDGTVTPRGEMPTTYAEEVRERLSEKGYSVGEQVAR